MGSENNLQAAAREIDMSFLANKLTIHFNILKNCLHGCLFAILDFNVFTGTLIVKVTRANLFCELGVYSRLTKDSLSPLFVTHSIKDEVFCLVVLYHKLDIAPNIQGIVVPIVLILSELLSKFSLVE